jgi:hypothetical protein
MSGFLVLDRSGQVGAIILNQADYLARKVVKRMFEKYQTFVKIYSMVCLHPYSFVNKLPIQNPKLRSIARSKATRQPKSKIKYKLIKDFSNNL